MRKNFTAIIAFVSLAVLARAPFAFSNELSKLTRAEVLHPHSLSSEESHTLAETQFIFIDGIFGDFFKNNFNPPLRVLSGSWAPVETLMIRPKSVNAIETNAEILFEKLKIYRSVSSKKNAVIIAHSKGAAETLLMLLKHPEAVQTLGLSRVMLASAPIGGTDVIDYVEHNCADLPHPLCQSFNRKWPMFDTFTPAHMSSLISTAMNKLNPQQRTLVAAKIFYIRTQMKETDVLSRLYFPHLYLTLIHPEEGPNDGLIPTRNQILYENGTSENHGDKVFGTDLGIIFGDHNSLFNAAHFKKTEMYREAFMRAILRTVLF